MRLNVGNAQKILSTYIWYCTKIMLCFISRQIFGPKYPAISLQGTQNKFKEIQRPEEEKLTWKSHAIGDFFVLNTGHRRDDLNEFLICFTFCINLNPGNNSMTIIFIACSFLHGLRLWPILPV